MKQHFLACLRVSGYCHKPPYYATINTMLKKILIVILLAASMSGVEEASGMYRFAYGLFKDKNYQLAIEQFQKISSLYPSAKEAADSAYMTAECYFNLGSYEQAIKEYNNVLDRHSTLEYRDSVAYRIGESFFALKKYEEALDAFKKIIPGSYLYPDSLYWTGECYFNLEKLEDAVVLYEKVVKDYPEFTHADFAYYSMGWCYYRLGKYQTAAVNFAKISLKTVNSPLTETSLFWKGEALFLGGSFDQSIIAFEEFLKKNPAHKNSDAASYRVGECFYKLKDYKFEFIFQIYFIKKVINFYYLI